MSVNKCSCGMPPISIKFFGRADDIGELINYAGHGMMVKKPGTNGPVVGTGIVNISTLKLMVDNRGGAFDIQDGDIIIHDEQYCSLGRTNVNRGG